MPQTMHATVTVGQPDRTAPGRVVVFGLSRHVDSVTQSILRLPWMATFTDGRLADGWLSGPLIEVLTRRGTRPPHDLVREISRAAHEAIGGDNLPRVVGEAAPEPDNVLAFPGRSANNPPERRFPDAD